MYEHMTFDFILQRMLDHVPDDLDKREGSIIYDALAPAAAELAQFYIDLDINYNLSFADSAVGDFLSRRTAEFGINRRPATKAIRKGLFIGTGGTPFNVPIGSRYAIDELTYIVVAQISTGAFRLECETAGVVGNQKFGDLLPITSIPGLESAELVDVLVPGEDEETDEALRERFFTALNEPAFGGNEADYKLKINGLTGVGATKIYPAWAGGGTVKAVILASDWGAPSTTLINEVQTLADPEINSGLGLGFAPIGHRVTVTGVSNFTVNVETSVTLELGVSIGEVQADVEEVIAAYLAELRKDWANVTQIVVRVAQMDARILTVQGIVDVSDTTLNGSTANLLLQSDDIPLLGTVTIND